MIGYLCYFKTKIINGLQYKSAAYAGILTQVFWGFLNIMLFVAFYSHVSNNVDISLKDLITYVWLNQAFLKLIYLRVNDAYMLDSIKNGTVAYELCRPYDLYFWWYIKFLADKYASVLLRFLPIIVMGFFLPEPYKLQLPVSFMSFILFIITLILGSFIICGILMIIQSISFFTTEGKGISDVIFIIGDLFTGSLLPLPLMPKIIQHIGLFLPFRLISDLPFRVYSGNIGINSAIECVGLQLIWIVVLIVLGELIMKKALKKVCIQGG